MFIYFFLKVKCVFSWFLRRNKLIRNLLIVWRSVGCYFLCILFDWRLVHGYVCMPPPCFVCVLNYIHALSKWPDYITSSIFTECVFMLSALKHNSVFISSPSYLFPLMVVVMDTTVFAESAVLLCESDYLFIGHLSNTKWCSAQNLLHKLVKFIDKKILSPIQ